MVATSCYVTAQDAAIFKAQERETSPVCQIKDFLYPELRQFLSQSFFHRLSQPVAAGMGVDQYHDVIRKTCVLKVLTIQPRKCRSEAIMARMLSELPEFSFFAKSFILRVHAVLARHNVICMHSGPLHHDAVRNVR